jgi:hypothetical protein
MNALPLLIQTVMLAVSLRLGALPGEMDAVIADRLTPAEMETVTISRERIALPVETQLLVPEGSAAEAFDPRFGTKYSDVCYAYIKENGLFVRRFAVHSPDRESRPIARNAARYMALVWQTANLRFGPLSRRLREKPVDIWMTRVGRAGGEQVGSSIYIYDLQADRSPIEWARELAHEYGHYLLPGASGYKEPEDWSNGLLGERLFLRWLREDIAAGRTKQEQLTFVKSSDIADYCDKQPEPLIDRIRARGADGSLLAKKSAAAMDELSALLLYVDATYGARVLIDLLDFLPVGSAAGAKPEDFSAALASWIASARRFETRLPTGAPVRLLLPRGKFRVTAAGSPFSILLDRGSALSEKPGTWNVTVSDPGWRTITVRGLADPPLRWERL